MFRIVATLSALVLAFSPVLAQKHAVIKAASNETMKAKGQPMKILVLCKYNC